MTDRKHSESAGDPRPVVFVLFGALASLHGADPLPPYVRLIHDVLLGDRSLFTRPDGLAAVWDVAEPLLSHPPAASTYPAGSWGPAPST